MIIGLKPDGHGGAKTFDLGMDSVNWGEMFGYRGSDEATLRASVDWMFRCVALLSGAAAAVPYTISPIKGKSDPIHDSDKDDLYPPALAMYEPLDAALSRIVASYVVLGRAYMIRQRNAGRKPVGLRYLNAATIRPQINANGLAGFRRHMPNGVIVDLKPDDILYLWYPDETIEMGEPNAYPGKAALAAAGVLREMDTFMANYFQRGMIKATLFMTKGMVLDTERSRIKDWWARVAGGNKNAFATEVINADDASIVQIGDGIGELGNVGLTQEKREGISTALGVPHSLVMSNAANYATAEQDVLNLYQNTVIPLCKDIQRYLNDQLFKPMGYWFRFEYGRIEAVQKSELAKAAMVQALVGKPVLTVNEGRELLGYDPVEGGDDLMQPQPAQLMPGNMPDLLPPPPMPKADDTEDESIKSIEMKRLGRFIKNGTYLARPFTSDILTPAEIEAAIVSHEWAAYP